MICLKEAVRIWGLYTILIEDEEGQRGTSGRKKWLQRGWGKGHCGKTNRWTDQWAHKRIDKSLVTMSFAVGLTSLILQEEKIWVAPGEIFFFFFFFFDWGMRKEFPGPGSKPKPQQWQHQILNLLDHQETPGEEIFDSWVFGEASL